MLITARGSRSWQSTTGAPKPRATSNLRGDLHETHTQNVGTTGPGACRACRHFSLRGTAHDSAWLPDWTPQEALGQATSTPSEPGMPLHLQRLPTDGSIEVTVYTFSSWHNTDRCDQRSLTGATLPGIVAAVQTMRQFQRRHRDWRRYRSHFQRHGGFQQLQPHSELPSSTCPPTVKPMWAVQTVKPPLSLQPKLLKQQASTR